ncbi:hypothetical protein Y032_0147g2615 [Ancylostoma ceylanicum]|uniref:Uncharacterized protein n=1 Tax=Ancylostoma ceylanicum TaxID=53326 RepID=A0A016T234_9BILA|nr:hypothetical protein Y032_0147g2615 [Ancylostoma ceylanicum]
MSRSASGKVQSSSAGDNTHNAPRGRGAIPVSSLLDSRRADIASSSSHCQLIGWVTDFLTTPTTSVQQSLHRVRTLYARILEDL